MTTYPFPGYVADVVALTGRVEATWGNAIRDRTLQVFTTAGARDTAIPSPEIGMTCIITQGASAGEYTYTGNTVGWTKPWNTPWGYIARSVSTTDHTAVTGEQSVTGISVTWTAVANRWYRTTVHMPRVQQISNDSEMLGFIADGSNSHISGGAWTQYLPVNHTASMILWTLEDGIAAGSTTRKLRVSSGFANGKVFGATVPGYIIVEDLGPSGAPS